MTTASEPPGGDQQKGARATNTTVVEADLLRHECELVRTAYAILLRRRRRLDEFNSAIFGEPAWDMLLELYVRETSGVSSTAEQLKAAPVIPASTAARWIKHLENDGIIVLHDHPNDRGTAFVELTDRGRQALDRYLTAIRDLNPTVTASEPAGSVN